MSESDPFDSEMNDVDRRDRTWLSLSKKKRLNKVLYGAWLLSGSPHCTHLGFVNILSLVVVILALWKYLEVWRGSGCI
jgi:hypothetical protein